MLYDVGWNQPIGESLLDAKVYWNDEEMRDRNYASCDIVWFSGNTCQPGVDGALVLDQKIETDRSRGGRIDFSYPFDFGSPLGAHELGVGVERHEVRFGDKVYNYFDPDWNSTFSFYPFDYPGYSPSSEGISHGCYREDEWWVSDQISATLGLRFDHFHNKPLKEGSSKEFTEWAFNPKATAMYSFGSGNSIAASVYQAFRAPGQPEIYWWSNPQIYPGGSGLTLPEEVLKAEKSKAIELTYQHPLDIGKVNLAGWYYRVDDYLMLRFDPRVYISYNIEHMDLYWLLVDMRLDVMRWLSLNASVAFQKTGKSGDFLDPGNDLDGVDYIPEWKAFAGTDIKLPHEVFRFALFEEGDSFEQELTVTTDGVARDKIVVISFGGSTTSHVPAGDIASCMVTGTGFAPLLYMTSGEVKGTTENEFTPFELHLAKETGIPVFIEFVEGPTEWGSDPTAHLEMVSVTINGERVY